MYAVDRKVSNPEARRTTQDGAILGADYGVTERFAVGILVPYRNSRSTGRVEGDVEGLGDVTLSVRFGLTDPHASPLRIGALFTASVPTGDVETGFLDQNIVLGVGAVSLGGGLEVIRDWPSGTSLFFRTLGSKPTGPSDEGIRYGGTISASAGYGRPFVLRREFRWSVSGTILWTEPDEQDGRDALNRGGRLGTLAGGVGIPLGGDRELFFGVQRLLDAQVRGDQLVATWGGYLGFRWSVFFDGAAAELP